MSRRKKRTSKKESNTLKYIVWVLTVAAIVLSSFVVGYYIGYDDAKGESLKRERVKKARIAASERAKIADSVKKECQSDINERLKEVLKKDTKKSKKIVSIPAEYESASHEVEGAALPTPPKRSALKRPKKPKLAIIIDDVSVRSHVHAIKSLNLPITMSFLPPSKFRPNSHKLAAKEDFYMVHLPMEAKNFTKEEPFTLKVGDSQRKIAQRIAEIKKLFPKVTYINNHTGSKFTSDERAVNRLVFELDKQNIDFIDSRTIASTQVENVMKNYGKQYLARDIFLDHKHEKEYVKSQIKKAVHIAKIHGTAIAIGHPHANTILAINESKKLFEEIELVLVDGLY